MVRNAGTKASAPASTGISGMTEPKASTAIPVTAPAVATAHAPASRVLCER